MLRPGGCLIAATNGERNMAELGALVRGFDPPPRVASLSRPPGFAVMAQSDSAWWGYYWDQISARVSTSLPQRIWMAYDKSTDLLSPRRVNDLSDRMKDLDAGKIRRLLDLASVGVLTSYREMEDPFLIPAGQVARQTNVPLRFYRSRDPLPRAYLVGRVRPDRAGARVRGVCRGPAPLTIPGNGLRYWGFPGWVDDVPGPEALLAGR